MVASCNSQIAQVLQPLFDHALFSLISLGSIVAHKFAQGVFQQLFESAEPRSKFLLGLRTQLGGEIYGAHFCQGSNPSTTGTVFRTRVHMAVATKRSSSSNPNAATTAAKTR